jgi:hypothetical protein
MDRVTERERDAAARLQRRKERAQALLTPPAERSDGQREILAEMLGASGHAKANGHAKTNGHADGPPRAEPVLLQASTISAKPVNWLWQWWLARGSLAVIDADPGMGKSTLTLDIAARLSRGDPMPFGPADLREPAATLLLCDEDDAETTVRPRLDLAGADASRVHIFSHVRLGKEELPVTIPHHLDLVGPGPQSWASPWSSSIQSWPTSTAASTRTRTRTSGVASGRFPPSRDAPAFACC